MSKDTSKTALALQPMAETFGYIPLMMAMREHLGIESWLELKEFAFDLEAVAPQVVWVENGEREAFEAKLTGMDIAAREVSKEEADRIKIENKPVRGTIDLHIRTRDSSINSEMIKDLKAQELISGCRMGENADGLFHWKDDRWYQDFHLTIFKESDIPQIESVIGDCGYIVVRPEDDGQS